MARSFPALLALAAVLAMPARSAPRAAPPDRSTARFAACGHGPRVDCVVDGDTFWLAGEKIRIADINAPETHGPQCAHEAALGAAAAARLTGLLNAGPFALEPWSAPINRGRDRDRYGRLLRVVERDGSSLGTTLVREGLAEQWTGHRRNWC